MISKSQRLPVLFSSILLLVAFLYQDTQSASAREYKEQCKNVTRSVLRPTGETFAETYRVPPSFPGQSSRMETRTVNKQAYFDETRSECLGESTIGAAIGFSNGNTTYGVSYKNRFSPSFSGRITYLFTNEAAAALTSEIPLGSAVDFFLGLGYDYKIQKQGGYTFVTTGIDYQLTDRVELNGTVRIPVSGSGNNVNYTLGVGFNF
jgi:hypothetical protein